ncbi:MAG: Cell division protein ftsA [Parcubacteria group bacterium Licking1014_17]|nr:MAG: Cell division protein ftsA [Parcubacteria group bacterium Licking1014_17]
MAKSNIICGIDIGNSNVKTVIADLNSETYAPRIIGVGNAPSQGLRRGDIVDIEETINDIGNSVRQAQNMAGVNVSRAYVALNGLHIKSQLSHGVVAVARPDSEITPSDISRVTDAASTISLPPNYEIVHIIPRGFTIDSNEHIKNAVGMKGVRLEADVLIIEALTQHMRNLAKCVNANNIEIEEFVYAPMAAAQSVLNKHQREYGTLLVDFGGGVTSTTLFFEGELLHTSVLPIGSKYLTHDITIALRTEMDKAELIKLNYGQIGEVVLVSKRNDIVDVSELIGEEETSISRKQISKIIDARVSDLFDFINGELKKVTAPYMLPAGIVLVGGGSKLPGIIDTAKNQLRLSVHRGKNRNFDGLSVQIDDPGFAVAAGLIAWGADGMIPNKKKLGGIAMPGFVKKIKGWFRNFLP